MKKLFRNRVTAVVLAVAMVFGIVGVALANFSDIQGHWAENTILKWEKCGFAKGYPDGTFKPNGNVTRAEFVAFVDRYFGFTNKGTERVPFPDVLADAWYGYDKEGGVPIAKTRGLLVGFGDPNFHPNQAITRAEAFTIIARALGLTSANISGKIDVYVDVDALNNTTKVYLGALVDLGIVNGDYNSLKQLQLRPNDPLTRAEAITILDQISNKFPWIFGKLGVLVYVNADVLNAVTVLVQNGKTVDQAIALINNRLNTCGLPLNDANVRVIIGGLVPSIFINLH